MGIINRTMDASEQKDLATVVVTNPVNQQDIPILVAPRAMTVSDAKVSLLGISGAPTLLLKALRFVAGTGGSTFNLGTTFAITAFGTSGFISYSLVASGSTQLNLQKGDMVVAVQGGGTGAASTTTIIELVTQNVQDIKAWY